MPEDNTTQKGLNRYNVTAFGNQYTSLRHLAESHYIEPSVLYERIQTGVTPEEAVNMGDSKYRLTVFGKTHKNVICLSEYYGIDYSILFNRISRGHDIEKVVTELLNKEDFVFEDKHYDSLVDLCNDYGVQITAVVKRLRRGWSIEDAVLKPIERRISKNSYSYRGETYNTQRELTDAHGLSIDIVRTLSKKIELDFIPALDILVTFLNDYEGARPKKVSKIPFIIYNGEWIDTLKDFCAQVGIEERDLKMFKKEHKVETHFETLLKMQNYYRVRWVDNLTGEVTPQSKLIKRYNTDIKTLERNSVAIKAKIKTYPTLEFNSTCYYATPLLDFEDYLKQSFPK